MLWTFLKLFSSWLIGFLGNFSSPPLIVDQGPPARGRMACHPCWAEPPNTGVPPFLDFLLFRQNPGFQIQHHHPLGVEVALQIDPLHWGRDSVPLQECIPTLSHTLKNIVRRDIFSRFDLNQKAFPFPAKQNSKRYVRRFYSRGRTVLFVDTNRHAVKFRGFYTLHFFGHLSPKIQNETS